MLDDIRHALRSCADMRRAELCQRYFKTSPGEYASGDIFLGVPVPDCRRIAKQFMYTPKNVWLRLLQSRYHEERFVALVIMIHQFDQGDESIQKDVAETYLSNTSYINNWDLVDISAHKIIGNWLLRQTRFHEEEASGISKYPTPKLLLQLSKSPLLWDRRISIISTFAFIGAQKLNPTFDLAEALLPDTHDLMHKAVGWALREAGKVDEKRLREFLDKNVSKMPRTMLRYALEKFDEPTRKHYLHL